MPTAQARSAAQPPRSARATRPNSNTIMGQTRGRNAAGAVYRISPGTPASPTCAPPPAGRAAACVTSPGRAAAEGPEAAGCWRPSRTRGSRSPPARRSALVLPASPRAGPDFRPDSRRSPGAAVCGRSFSRSTRRVPSFGRRRIRSANDRAPDPDRLAPGPADRSGRTWRGGRWARPSRRGRPRLRERSTSTLCSIEQAVSEPALGLDSGLTQAHFVERFERQVAAWDAHPSPLRC